MILTDAIVLAQRLLSDFKTEDRALQKQIAYLRHACVSVKHVTALCVHLYRFTHLRCVPKALKKTIDESLLTPLKLQYNIERNDIDAFQNPVLNAEFESQLSYAILQAGDLTALLKINDAIISYLKRHHDDLLKTHGHIIRAELTIYKIPFNQAVSSVEALIELLARPFPEDNEKKRIQILSETFTLHLLFFNYQHVYDPTRDISPNKDTIKPRDEASPALPLPSAQASPTLLSERESEKHKALEEKRQDIHRSVRPKGDDKSMFEEKIRGRVSVYSKKRSRHFGICDDDHTSIELQNIHAYDFTPHKYRAKPNLDSPLVRHLKAQGVSFIAGPSGTAADCIEGLQFLCPSLSPKEYQHYLNLLAAAETGQGHHSIHEVILTSVHAGVLSVIKAQDKTKPFWERLDYDRTYVLFLSDQFKKSPAYQHLCLLYPQYLGHKLVWDETKESHLKAAKAATSWRAATSAKVAGKHFKTAPFWETHASNFNETDEKTSFIRQISSENFTLLTSEVTALSDTEKRFYRVFCAQTIALTHATTKLPDIETSGCILSDIGLTKTIGSHTGKSHQGDAAKLHNNDYVFFRFELQPVHHKSSRFGGGKIVLDGRAGNLLQHTWISLFEMLAPQQVSILNCLRYDGTTVRTYAGYYKGVVSVNYKHSAKQDIIDLGRTIFAGNELMPGLALCMIRELRRIGGAMQADFLGMFTAERLELDSPDYQVMIEKINYMLSRLFRVEAKTPRRVLLRDVKYRIMNPNDIKAAIDSGNLFKLRHCLTDKDIHQPIWSIDSVAVTAIEYAVLTNQTNIVLWLRKQGVLISPNFINVAMTVDSKIIQLTADTVRVLFKEHKLLNTEDRSTFGCTWLHVAVEKGQYDALRPLIQAGVSPSAKDKKDKDFLSYLEPYKILRHNPRVVSNLLDLYKQLDLPNDKFIQALKTEITRRLAIYTCKKRKIIITSCSILFEDKDFLNKRIRLLLEETDDHNAVLQLLAYGGTLPTNDDDTLLVKLLCNSLFQQPSEAEAILSSFAPYLSRTDTLTQTLPKKMSATISQGLWSCDQIKNLISAYPSFFRQQELINASLKRLLTYDSTSSLDEVCLLIKKGAVLPANVMEDLGKILFASIRKDIALFQKQLEALLETGISRETLIQSIQDRMVENAARLSPVEMEALLSVLPEYLRTPSILNAFLRTALSGGTEVQLACRLCAMDAELPVDKDQLLQDLFTRIVMIGDVEKAKMLIGKFADKASINCRYVKPFYFTSDPECSLRYCASKQQYDMLDFILEQAPGIDAIKGSDGLTYYSILGKTVISLMTSDIDKALDLLERYPDLIKQNPLLDRRTYSTHLFFNDKFHQVNVSSQLTHQRLRRLVALGIDLQSMRNESHSTLLMTLIENNQFNLAISLLSYVHPSIIMPKDAYGKTAGDYLMEKIMSVRSENLLLSSQPVRALSKILFPALTYLPLNLIERLIKEQAIPELLFVMSLHPKALNTRPRPENLPISRVSTTHLDELSNSALIDRAKYTTFKYTFMSLVTVATKRIILQGKSKTLINKILAAQYNLVWRAEGRARFQEAYEESQSSPLKRLKQLPEYQTLLDKVSEEAVGDEDLREQFLKAFHEKHNTWSLLDFINRP